MATDDVKSAPARAGEGTVEQRGKRWYGRVSIPGVGRPWIPLGEDMTEARALEKLAALVELGRKGDNLLECVNRVRGKAGLAPVGPAGGRATPVGETVEDFGTAWTSGELLKRHGNVNGLKVKASADVDAWRLKAYVYPLLKGKRVADVTEQDMERVMAKLPADSSAETRKKMVSLLRRLFDLAIVPGRLRADNPVTKHLRPSKGAAKLFSYLYPVELLAVLACVTLPIGRRIFYALACYTGLRKGTLFALRWRDVDLKHGTITALVTKTDVPQMFEIGADLAGVLARWKAARKGEPDDLVVAGLEVEKGREAGALRADLRAARVTREILFSDAPNVEPLRFHDLRATFVTWAKRAGKGEGWITDRTGHLDAKMVARYSRAARTLADLKMEPFPALATALPDLPTLPPTPPDSGDLGPSDPSSGGALGPENEDPGTLAHDSGSSGVTLVGVQVPLFAPSEIKADSGDAAPAAGTSEKGRVGRNVDSSAILTARRRAQVGLSELVAAMIRESDFDGATILTETIRKLVAAPMPAGAEVIGIEQARARRDEP